MRLRHLLLVGGAVACEPAPTASPEPAEITCATGEIDRPQGVAWMGDRLVVASTGFGDPWRTGRITVFDAAGQVIASRPTAWLNPQTLRVEGDDLVVVSSGAFDLSSAVPRMETDGGVEVFDHDLVLKWSAALPSADGGGPVGVALHADRAVVGSGIRAEAYVLDTAAGRWRRDAAEPVRFGSDLGLGAPVRYGDRTLIVDYNADTLVVLDADDVPWRCRYPLADSDRLAGAKAPVVLGDDLYYLLDNAGLLMRVPLAGLPQDDPGAGCAPLPREALWVTGQLPNHLAADASHLYVVQSGDNNVVALDRETFEPAARYALPPGSNPWQVAVHPTTGRLAVSEWLSDAVAFIDPIDASIRRVACGATTTPVPPARRRPDQVLAATRVASAPTAGDGPFKDPQAAVNGVRGGGDQAGSVDVYSVGLEADDHLVVCFDGRAMDGPGADVAVFENPFDSGAMRFMDPAIVEVSPDGDAWVAFPHDYTAPDETEYLPDPRYWQGFAGVTPVRLDDEADPPGDPFDGAFAGGDGFDFADLPGPVGATVRERGARCVRISGAAARINPDTDAPFPKDPVSNGPDIDGVYGRRVE